MRSREENGEFKALMLGSGISSGKSYSELLEIVKLAIQNGIYGFDTAPSYHTEEILGTVISQCIRDLSIDRDSLFIQTKIDAWQMQNGRIEFYVEQALQKLSLDYIDSLLIHWPLPKYFYKTWERFLLIKERGLVRNIGVCNVRLRQLEELVTYQHIPQIVQIERNPLRTCNDEVRFCENYEIEVQAYSPLCKMNSLISESPLLKILCEKYNKSIGQIILRWHLDTGVIPIFATRNSLRIKEYANIMDFSLSHEDLTAITSMNINYKMYLESCHCPGF